MSGASAAQDELTAIVERLRTAVKGRFGSDAEVDNVEVATLGGSNRTLLFDLKTAERRRRLVFRQETVTLENSPFIAPEKQYEVIKVAFAHGVPVPEPIFQLEPTDGLGRSYVVAHVAGETLPKRLLSDAAFAEARTRYVGQAGEILARLHAIDAAEVSVLESVPHSHDALKAQTALYDHYGEPHPALEFAFRWLEHNRPDSCAPCFLHGDFRNGNMIVNHAGIQAVLDWECAHLGDPVEDLGWMCTRSWRFGHIDKPAGGFGTREDLYRAYEQAGGRPVDRAVARWWEIFGLLRWALFNVMQVFGHMAGVRRSPAFAACGRNTCLIEYDLLMTIAGRFD
ncbi:MAG: phosphotransferase family protein [Gammaproteobacteria bacterium]|nr:phosphotransferase family protein [Gammaproteobacteria bacterium]